MGWSFRRTACFLLCGRRTDRIKALYWSGDGYVLLYKRLSNGRVGRLILFKECLRCGIVPFIVDDRHKMFYYRGLKEWPKTPGCLRDTCLLMQDDFKASLQYFGIEW